MLDAFSNSQWKLTLLLFAICGALAVVAGVVGIDDSLPGQSLVYLSGTALVLAFVHPWRTSRRFLYLTGASVLGFFGFAILSNVTPAGFEGIFFVIALFLCPAAPLVGIVGAVASFVTSRREHRHHAPPASPVT